MKTGAKLAVTLFILVAIAHGMRLLFSIPVTAGAWNVPQWISLFGLAIPALIAWMLWRENRP